MLRIRLRRVGKKRKPSYRIVVAEAGSPRDGAYVEWIGNYDPMADPPVFSIKEDRALQWLSQGAQPSDAVMRILDKSGIIQRTPLMRTRNRGSTSVSAPEIAVQADPANESTVKERASAVSEVAAEEEAVAADQVPTEDEAIVADQGDNESPAIVEAATDDESHADELPDEEPSK